MKEFSETISLGILEDDWYGWPRKVDHQGGKINITTVIYEFCCRQNSYSNKNFINDHTRNGFKCELEEQRISAFSDFPCYQHGRKTNFSQASKGW